VNYEDPHLNVELPVFAIHGNHDDPSGEANLSAMDILASAGLLNYFGKHALGGGGAGRIDLKPVLLRKGSTRVALYGLGYIRDNRLHQMFSIRGNVRWHRPAETADCSSSSWFNVMLIHQNRAAHSKNAISERYLPSWLDYVVWGHEHECLIEPTESTQGFHVSQPGSSVVTSLIDGESKEKRICVLEVRSDPDNPNAAPYWRTAPIPLLSTRPFEFEQLSFSSTPELVGADAAGVSAFLENRVRGMIARATRKLKERNAGKEVDMTDRMNLPLIRLRVDYSGGFSTINPQRFGQKFVGVVANPHDILLFHKAQKKRARDDADMDEMTNAEEVEIDDVGDVVEGALQDQRRIDKLVREHLANDELQLLTSHDLSAALDDFVNRDEKAAIAQLCATRLKDVQQTVNADDEERFSDNVDKLVSKIYEAVKEQLKKPMKRKLVMDENVEQPTTTTKKSRSRQNATTASTAPQLSVHEDAQKRAPSKRSAAKRQAIEASESKDDDIEDSDDEVIPLSNPAQKLTRASRATVIASTRVKKKAASVTPRSDSDASFDEDDEIIEPSDDENVVASRGRKRAAAATAKPARRKSNTAATAKRRMTAGHDSGDDVDDEVVAPSRSRSARGTQSTTQNTWGRSRR